MRAVCAAAIAVGVLSACLSGQDVDLGRNLDAGAAALDSPIPLSPTLAGSDATTGTPSDGCRPSVESQSTCDAQATPPDSSQTSVDSGSPGPGPGPGPGPSDSGQRSPEASTVSPDGGGEAFCLRNGSFELMGASIANLLPLNWQLCSANLAPLVNPSLSTMPASDGANYLGLAFGSLDQITPDTSESVGTVLCTPTLQEGTTYSFSIDLAMAVKTISFDGGIPASSAPLVLEVYGAQGLCGRSVLLWRSPPITNDDAWKTYCSGPFTVPQPLAFLTLTAVPPPGTTYPMAQWGYLVIDNLVAGPCK